MQTKKLASVLVQSLLVCGHKKEGKECLKQGLNMQEFWLRRKENTHNMLLAVVRIKSGWDILCNSRAIRYQCPQKTEKVAPNIAYASLVCTST